MQSLNGFSYAAFLSAFRKELGEVERTGTFEQRQAVMRLREAVNKEQKESRPRLDKSIR